jgi:hypothetical protein
MLGGSTSHAKVFGSPAGGLPRPGKILAATKVWPFSGYRQISPAISVYHFLAQKVDYPSFNPAQRLSLAIAAAIAGDFKLW